MTEHLSPVCCFIEDDSLAACNAVEDLFEIISGPLPEDYTIACRTHLGEMIDGVPLHRPVWRSSTVVAIS